MISDVLAEAIARIRSYQTAVPHAYADVRNEIDVVVSLMDALRGALDLPPDVNERHRAMLLQKIATCADAAASVEGAMGGG
jgi:hypothetical protein